MDTATLALSVLGTEMKALAFRKGIGTAHWEGPEVADPTENFLAHLRDLLSKIQPDGREVAMVLAHPRLNDQIVEIPPAKRWVLARLLERQAQNCKTFPGAAVWSWQPALPTKKANAALLHLLPKTILDQLSYACQQAHLRLVRVLPTSAVLIGHLKSLPLEKDEVALLAAETGSSTTIVIGRKDGRIALGRVLANSWATEPDRVWVDLTRSVGFAEQQCGVTVSSVWLFGPGAPAQLETVQGLLKLPVRLSPIGYTPYYWAEQAVRLPDKNDGSLISPELRFGPRRRKILAATLTILALLVLMSLAAAGTVEVLRQLELKSVRDIERVSAKLQERKTEWQRKNAEVARKEELARMIRDQTVPPVPLWILSYLGEVLPDDLVLTELRVARTNENWALRLAGNSTRDLPPPGASATPAIPPSFVAFTNALASGPWRMRMTRGAFGPPANPQHSPRVKPPRAEPNVTSPGQFWVEGVIQ